MSGSGPFADDKGCQDFVANLVNLRKTLGWTQQQLAGACHVSPSVISNFESFQRAPRPEHGKLIDKGFRLTGMFEGKAREIQDGVSFPPAFRAFSEYEKTATDLFISEHSLVSGLFQTEPYARGILTTHPNVSSAVVDERVSARLARQEILFREEPVPPRVWALLDEGALRRRVGDAATMHEQLTRLLTLSDLTNVTIQIIEGVKGHVGVLGAFTLAEIPERTSIVHLEDIADGRMCEDSATVDQARLNFRTMQAEALHTQASRALITEIAEDMWNRTSPPHGGRAPTAAATAGSASKLETARARSRYGTPLTGTA